MDTNAKPRPLEESNGARVFTVDELAEVLRLDRKAVYDAIRRGDIPGVRRIGKVYRISTAAVLHWLGAG